MATYDFYVNSYRGSAIPEAAFDGAAARAGEILDRLCRICRVEGGEEAKAMAICAMAETLYAWNKHQGAIASAVVGEVSVRYHTPRKESLLGRLYRQAGVYLDIYRGRA